MRPALSALAGLALVGILAGGTEAQSIAMGGSESFVLDGPAVVGGGGVASSAGYSAAVVIEAPTVPHSAQSETLRLLAGPALFGAEPTGAPILFGVREGTGTKDGGQAVTLFGRDLTGPGAGTTTASLGPAAIQGLTPVSPLSATGTTGPAVNVHGNPLGLVQADVTHTLGTSSRPGAWAYTPAIVLDGLPKVGSSYGLSLHAGAGDWLSMSWGVPIPGVAVPLFNLDGAIELLTQITPVMPFTPAPASGHHQLTLPVPDAPSLAGIQVPLQALAFDDLATLTGSFTNLFLLPIQ